MLNTIEKYRALTTVKLEGFESLITKYKVIVTTMQKKGYDFLDQRKATFDDDFDYFNNQIAQLAQSVLVFSETAINKRPSATRCLEVLNRYIAIVRLRNIRCYFNLNLNFLHSGMHAIQMHC